jgi:hypothetical protein
MALSTSPWRRQHGGVLAQAVAAVRRIRAAARRHARHGGIASRRLQARGARDRLRRLRSCSIWRSASAAARCPDQRQQVQVGFGGARKVTALPGRFGCGPAFAQARLDLAPHGRQLHANLRVAGMHQRQDLPRQGGIGPAAFSLGTMRAQFLLLLENRQLGIHRLGRRGRHGGHIRRCGRRRLPRGTG